MSSARGAIVYSAEYECDIGEHVFPTRKFRMVRDRLLAEGAAAPADVLEAPQATRDELQLVHTAAYLDDLAHLRWTPRTLASELPLSGPIVRAYELACGGTVLAAREALRRGASANLGGGFHHAFADRAEGFCYLNDLAVGIRVLQRDRAIRRAAVVDLDVHQGNGTARIFAGDGDVFTLSIHQEANYPMPKEPGDLDVGLADGIGDADYLAQLDAALERVWAFGPELVMYQAGADPYRDDQLGGLALSLEGLAARDRRVIDGAATRGVPVVVTLGGGYARQLEDTVAIHAFTCAAALAAARSRTTSGQAS